MFKSSYNLFLIVLIVVFSGTSFASTNPDLHEKRKVESDSLNANKDTKSLDISEVKSQPSSTETTTSSFWESSEEVEEDSTANSALSFNFIYFIIEKFKFQVE